MYELVEGEDYTIEYLTIDTENGRRSGYELLTTTPCFVDHDTGNDGSTARNNADYYARTYADEQASAHAFIDDEDTIILIPMGIDEDTSLTYLFEKAWHVRYAVTTDNELFGDDANDVAIGVELCYFSDDEERSLKAYNRYIKFAAWLAYKLGSDVRLRAGHFELDPARRTDPENALSYIDKTYDDMTNDIYDLYVAEFDTPDTDTAAEYAQEAQTWVIDNSISDGTDPYGYTTREQVWTMLYRLSSGEEITNTEDDFEPAATWVVNNDISDGLRPKENVTRVEMWSLLARTYGGLEITDDWEAEGRLWAVKYEISDGLTPSGTLERQQLWTMLYRVYTTFLS